jgi:hypothetical protein
MSLYSFSSFFHALEHVLPFFHIVHSLC